MTTKEQCECGRGEGKHPYPIGGGWALACDECRAESIADIADGASEDMWLAWLAFGGSK